MDISLQKVLQDGIGLMAPNYFNFTKMDKDLVMK